MIIYDNKNVKLDYDASKKLLVQTWTGFASSSVFREAIDKSVELSATNPVHFIISDTQKQEVVKPEDANYAASVMPKLLGNGLKAMAFVVPSSVFTKISLQKFSETSGDQATQYFDDFAKAKKWIDEKN